MARQSRSPQNWGLEITLRHTTFGRTSLDEWSARRREFWQHKTLTRDFRAPGGIRTSSNQAAAHPHIRPRRHRDLPLLSKSQNFLSDLSYWVTGFYETRYRLRDVRGRNVMTRIFDYPWWILRNALPTDLIKLWSSVLSLRFVNSNFECDTLSYFGV